MTDLESLLERYTFGEAGHLMSDRLKALTGEYTRRRYPWTRWWYVHRNRSELSFELSLFQHRLVLHEKRSAKEAPCRG